jgi:hypothetical protein
VKTHPAESKTFKVMDVPYVNKLSVSDGVGGRKGVLSERSLTDQSEILQIRKPKFFHLQITIHLGV